MIWMSESKYKMWNPQTWELFESKRRLFRQDFIMSTSVKNEVEDFPIINGRKGVA